jgi:GNAT superfamily N-acetyltransferase
MYQNGACYVTILARGPYPATVDGWACLTFEDEPWPVVGVYVKEEKRGQGWAKDLVNSLLRIHRGSILAKGGKIYAAVDRFPYRELCREHGYECVPWE